MVEASKHVIDSRPRKGLGEISVVLDGIGALG